MAILADLQTEAAESRPTTRASGRFGHWLASFAGDVYHKGRQKIVSALTLSVAP